jgi:hypothetical protein
MMRNDLRGSNFTKERPQELPLPAAHHTVEPSCADFGRITRSRPGETLRRRPFRGVFLSLLTIP